MSPDPEISTLTEHWNHLGTLKMLMPRPLLQGVVLVGVVGYILRVLQMILVCSQDWESYTSQLAPGSEIPWPFHLSSFTQQHLAQKRYTQVLDWEQRVSLRGLCVLSTYLDILGCLGYLSLPWGFLKPSSTQNFHPEREITFFSSATLPLFLSLPSWTPLSGTLRDFLISLSVRWNFFLHHVSLLSFSRAHK